MRGVGVVVTDSTSFVVKGCMISDNGMMGACGDLLRALLLALLLAHLLAL